MARQCYPWHNHHVRRFSLQGALACYCHCTTILNFSLVAGWFLRLVLFWPGYRYASKQRVCSKPHRCRRASCPRADKQARRRGWHYNSRCEWQRSGVHGCRTHLLIYCVSLLLHFGASCLLVFLLVFSVYLSMYTRVRTRVCTCLLWQLGDADTPPAPSCE